MCHSLTDPIISPDPETCACGCQHPQALRPSSGCSPVPPLSIVFSMRGTVQCLAPGGPAWHHWGGHRQHPASPQAKWRGSRAKQATPFAGGLQITCAVGICRADVQGEANSPAAPRSWGGSVVAKYVRGPTQVQECRSATGKVGSHRGEPSQEPTATRCHPRADPPQG